VRIAALGGLANLASVGSLALEVITWLVS